MVIAHLDSPNAPPLDVANPHYQGLGPALLASDGYLIAVQRAGIWEAPGKLVTGIQFIGKTKVVFFNPAVEARIEFGPLTDVQITDCSMWHQPDQRELIARYDEALGAWHIEAEPSSPMPHFTIKAAH